MRVDKVNTLYSGTSNIVLPVPNKLAFPEAFRNKSRLQYYASLFNSVEINSTFYKLPRPATIARWATEVPHHFKFTFKLWKEVSHQPKLAFSKEQLQLFVNSINQAENKLGCLLIQLPPSTSNNIQQFEHLLQSLRETNLNPACHIAAEFRNKSWYNPHTYNLLQSYQSAMVLHDMAGSAAPMTEQQANFIYLRFHGPQKGYRGSYTDDFLQEYALYGHEWLQEGKTVYAYFNNTLGSAIQNLITFNQLVSQIS